jgi:hypothetical protein
MAPWIKFLIPFCFGLAGLALFVMLPLWPGLIGFIGMFFLGSIIGTVLFMRYATPQQIRKDLEARLYND